MIQIRGLERLSLIDYPGKIAATVFFSGCNFRCGYCHNPELVEPDLIKKNLKISEEYFLNFLESRKGLIEGVCLTGGEPTINPDLPVFVKKIKEKGFLIKLDTNGSNPKMLKNLFKEKLLDFTAMDIKASKDKYSLAINQSANLDNIQKSINLIQESKIEYEFRTTVAPWLIDKTEIEKIGQWLKGAKHFSLQQFRAEKTLDKTLKETKPYSEKELNVLADILKKYVDRVELRGI
ncbi:MAG: anaerobic ribonucleoside-triphosphate reductase activating protein [Candidatus Portnoybacteria bacterium RIFCSPHIGHO2_12_FULL_40_11]|uniref:Anaerobic ribonucleoside-triphosphate reductase activating protein n=1 Tax=Candidatus Portnoybacteria bacterium RIFCSPHIGHO2_12_FULL_40_11 TaxID=1801998 RepID=A0A1G2FLZ7_9BACT|nr:MAG: anaerobic ribonucleoside-triphosphate reductase activating protein [Candidatus Portnoybacteria bacterium RIFCSPHIGHO2_12_FULL_40_11]